MSKLTLHHRTNVNEAHAEQMTIGQKIADNIAALVGSWRFVIVMTTALALWIILNIVGIFGLRWDIYPFILLNLCLSFLAGYTGPFIMMSQNRQAAKDRIAAEVDYAVNRKAEEHTEKILNHLDAQDQQILAIVQRLDNAQSAPTRKR